VHVLYDIHTSMLFIITHFDKQELMNCQRWQRSMKLMPPARCHRNLNLSKLIVNYCWIVSIFGKYYCLVIETISEKFRNLLKMPNVIWIVMAPSCMFFCHLCWPKSSCCKQCTVARTKPTKIFKKSSSVHTLWKPDTIVHFSNSSLLNIKIYQSKCMLWQNFSLICQ